MKNEIRKHYFLDKYVIITPGRAKRPKGTIAKAVIIPERTCPFCPDKIEKDLIIKGYPSLKNWRYLALLNKYPVVTLDNQKAYGQHEVIVETPSHLKELAQFKVEELVGLLEVYKDRTKELAKIKDIEYILIFKNEGGKAGATLIHAHSQVFASKILPPDVVEEQTAIRKYKAEKGICPYCHILKKEEKGPRRIFSNKEVVAFCPYASQYHYEAWILPRRHVDNIVDLTKKETISFALALKKILVKIFTLNLEYNFFLHQIVHDPDQHFFLKIQPREATWGGIELGSGIVVNSLSPEKAAQFYRK